MKIDPSYYSVMLLDYIRSSHPNLINNIEFINSRADLAAKACQNTKLQGHTSIEAEELANQILFDGLRFSVFDTIISILDSMFSDQIEVTQYREIAIQMYEYIDSTVTAKYEISDEFQTRDIEIYNKFYNELVGAITIYLEEYGVH